MEGSREKGRRDRAEGLAILALGFLAADGERLDRFLALTGLDPSRLREAAAAPGFLAGVLEHIAADERQLLQFAEEQGLDPAEVGAARAVLAGPVPDWGA
jgi:Protein of unknown function (DUF3572)